MKKIISLLAVLAMLTAISVGIVGCNTIRGAGKDIQRGGQAIQDAAN